MNRMSTNRNLNSKPENPYIARYMGAIDSFIHSQAFLFEEFNMNKSKFRRKIPLCACGCGQKVKKSKIKPYNWNKFIHGHNAKGQSNRGYKHTEEAKN